MKILSDGNINIDRQTIYMDVDDVIFKSRSTAVHMLREQYPNARVGEERSWAFKTTLGRKIRPEEVNELFNSQEFWDRNEFIDDFVDPLIDEFIKPNKYNLVFVTKGESDNIERKFKKLCLKFDMEQCGFIALDYSESKANVKMIEGIQIDDNYDFLKDTDARVKILYREVDDSDCNGFWKLKDNLPKLYVCQMEDEILEILRFNYEYKL